MKARVSFASAIVMAVVLSGCATLGEPQPHVEQCHVKDGMLLDRNDCIADHNQIVAERKAKTREQRLSRAIDRGVRR